MGDFYLCAKEGVYKVDPPHKHKTQFDASACTQKWAIELALENDKLRTHAEVRWEMIEAMALTCHELRKALAVSEEKIVATQNEGVGTPADDAIPHIKKALAIKPYQAEKIVAELIDAAHYMLEPVGVVVRTGRPAQGGEQAGNVEHLEMARARLQAALDAVRKGE